MWRDLKDAKRIEVAEGEYKVVDADYKATKELGKLTYLLNERSGFYKYRLYWNKQDMLVSNKSKYQIVLTRANKRHLAQIIKQNIHDYEQQP